MIDIIKEQIDKKIREIATYHGDEGTSRYLLSETQFAELTNFVHNLLIKERGFWIEARHISEQICGRSKPNG